MLTPIRSSFPGVDTTIDTPKTLALTLQTGGLEIVVSHDGFSIGSSPRCDLTIAESSVPSLHSVIHMQTGAHWIETVGGNVDILVNGRPVRRMALRDQDRLRIGETEFTVLLKAPSMVTLDHPVVNEDLTLLTAEELCDRIMVERSMVSEFISGQRSGWQALMHAIEAVHKSPVPYDLADTGLESRSDERSEFHALIEQIAELNETIAERSRELSEQENEILASTSMLEESQKQVVERIDEILDQLGHTDPPSELRVSA